MKTHLKVVPFLTHGLSKNSAGRARALVLLELLSGLKNTDSKMIVLSERIFYLTVGFKVGHKTYFIERYDKTFYISCDNYCRTVYKYNVLSYQATKIFNELHTDLFLKSIKGTSK